MQHHARLAAVLLVLALTAVGCASPDGTSAVGGAPTGTAPASVDGPSEGDGPTVAPSPAPFASAPEADGTAGPTIPLGDRVVVREVGRRAHDTSAFTQGLEFVDGRLLESRGLYASDEGAPLTEIDPVDGRVLRAEPRDPDDGDYFAEGLTVVGDRIIQLTWQENVAFEFDRDTFERTGTFTYDGEGWGLCHDDDRLVMSDGTPTLTFRDLATFEATGTVTVTLDGQPVERLNELECVGGLVWANIWLTPTIVGIDPADGRVVTVVDVTSLADDRGRSLEDPAADVLNGIAYDDQTDTWLLTGKLWPWMYEVEFDCVEGCEVSTASHYVRPRVAQ
jgi:glutaminyl-peptide cyclotransferase